MAATLNLLFKQRDESPLTSETLGTKEEYWEKPTEEGWTIAVVWSTETPAPDQPSLGAQFKHHREAAAGHIYTYRP